MTDQGGGYRSMDDGFAYKTEKLPPPLPEASVTQQRLSEADKLVGRVAEIARQNYSLARGECREHLPAHLAKHWEELPQDLRELFINLGLSCVSLGRELKA